MRSQRNTGWMLGMVYGAAAVAQPAVPDYDFDWCVIGEPGNPPYPGPLVDSRVDLPGSGQVNYLYRMSMTEVTTAQWVEYYNAFAQFDPDMAVAEQPFLGGIEFDRREDPPRWAVGDEPGDAMRPVSVPIRAAARYCNWLHNGKAMTHEAFLDGAYDTSTFGFSDVIDDFTDDYTRRPGARFFIPNLDEWLKAVYYDPDNPTRDGWWHYPYGSDEWPVSGLTGEPGAQTMIGEEFPGFSALGIPLMSYPEGRTPWGLMDVSGGTNEWTDFRVDRGVFGTGYRAFGSASDWTIFDQPPQLPEHPDEMLPMTGGHPDETPISVGLRVAAVVPCPADLASPYGKLDALDVITFLDAFMLGLAAADLSTPLGVFTVDDLIEFLAVFSGSCN